MTAYANDIVVDSYRKYLNRSPEPEGFAYWVGVVTNLLSEGKTTTDIESSLRDGFTGSQEYKTLHNL